MISMQDNCALAIVDLDSECVQSFEKTFPGPWWLSNTQNTIAFQSNTGKDPTVTVLSDGNEVTIPRAAYPCLSSDNRTLVYATLIEEEKAWIPSCDISIRDLKTQTNRILVSKAFLPDLSPDGKHISYVRHEKVADKTKFYLAVSDIEGKNARDICEISEKSLEVLMLPQWISNEDIAFKTTTPFTGRDNEIFVANVNGEIEQVTSNDYEEREHQLTMNGEVVYVGEKGSEGLPKAVGPVYISEKRDGEWHERPLGINAGAFKIAGRRIVYLTAEEVDGKPKQGLYVSDLTNLRERKNVAEIIRPYLTSAKFPETQPSTAPALPSIK
jgi:hypothetical protein